MEGKTDEFSVLTGSAVEKGAGWLLSSFDD
jgi:hypothetical protein